MNLRFLLAFVAAAWIAFGCAPKETGGPSADNAIASTESATATTDTAAAKSPSVDEIPAELKSDGYEYFALGNSKVSSFVQKGGATDDQTSSQQTIYMGVVDGKHTFKTVRTGATASIGDSEIFLAEDGLYLAKVGNEKLPKPSLEIPADLPVGKTWDSDQSFKIDLNGSPQTVEQKMKFKVAGIETIDTKLGKLDAVKIVGSGTISVAGNTSKNETSMWFAKGVGLVRMRTKSTQNGVTQTPSMEITEQK